MVADLVRIVLMEGVVVLKAYAKMLPFFADTRRDETASLQERASLRRLERRFESSKQT